MMIFRYHSTRWFPLSVLGMFLVAGGTTLAAGNAEFTTTTNMPLTIGSSSVTITIAAGSSADSLVVNESSFVVTISAGQRMIFGSTDRYYFTNDGGISTTCSGDSSLDITGTSTQQVITVNPNGNQCPAQSGGGGGGGGGGGSPSSSTPAPAATATPAPASSPAPDQLASTPSKPSTSYTLGSRNLKFGSSGNDVATLQDYLRSIGNYQGATTGFFDTATKNAVASWQKANKISPASGLFGSLSRAKYKKLTVPTPTPKPSKKSSSQDSSDLQASVYGSTGGTVKIMFDVGTLRVRSKPSVSGSIVGKVSPNQEFKYSKYQDGWYRIQKAGKDFGWVSGEYVTKQ